MYRDYLLVLDMLKCSPSTIKIEFNKKEALTNDVDARPCHLSNRSIEEYPTGISVDIRYYLISIGVYNSIIWLDLQVVEGSRRYESIVWTRVMMAISRHDEESDELRKYQQNTLGSRHHCLKYYETLWLAVNQYSKLKKINYVEEVINILVDKNSTVFSSSKVYFCIFWINFRFDNNSIR
jgi:hypothetical protein